MAIEDAAVLGNLLSRLQHPAELVHLLRGYEVIRHGRTAATQASSRLNQHIFHLPDGAEQEERDCSMRAAMEVELTKIHTGSGEKVEFAGEGNSNQWADRRKNVEQFGYDADEEAEHWWREKGERICRHAVARESAGVVIASRM